MVMLAEIVVSIVGLLARTASDAQRGGSLTYEGRRDRGHVLDGVDERRSAQARTCRDERVDGRKSSRRFAANLPGMVDDGVVHGHDVAE